MTSENEAEPITSEEELSTELKTLLRRAHRGGIDVEGGWDCRNGGGDPDWDVIVSQVRKKADSE